MDAAATDVADSTVISPPDAMTDATADTTIAPDAEWRASSISDGTMFVEEEDPLTTFDRRIRALQPDGTWKIVWREADASVVKMHIGEELLVGPP